MSLTMNMYSVLLTAHSLVRWLVLASLLASTVHFYRGSRSRKAFAHTDERIRRWATGIAEIQMTIGLVLYFHSPLTAYFRNNFSVAIHEREPRFFGMEHSLMMLVSVILISVGSSLARRKKVDQEKYKTLVIWFSLALLIIILNIPWQFSPLVSRPYYRPF